MKKKPFIKEEDPIITKLSLTKGYSWTPNIIWSSNLPLSYKAVMMFMMNDIRMNHKVEHGNIRYRMTFSQTKMAKLSGVTRQQVSKIYKSLSRIGVIVPAKTNHGGSYRNTHELSLLNYNRVMNMSKKEVDLALSTPKPVNSVNKTCNLCLQDMLTQVTRPVTTGDIYKNTNVTKTLSKPCTYEIISYKKSVSGGKDTLNSPDINLN